MRFSVAAALCAALCAPALADTGEPAIVKAGLNGVRVQPHSFLKTHFEFEARFDKLGQVYQPFFTMFDDYTHVNFSAWDADADLTTMEGYVDAFPLLYLGRRKADPMEKLHELKRFQRFRGIGVVQSIFGGYAFVEVLDVIPLDTELTEAAHRQAALTPKPEEVAAVETPATEEALPAPAAVEHDAAATEPAPAPAAPVAGAPVAPATPAPAGGASD